MTRFKTIIAIAAICAAFAGAKAEARGQRGPKGGRAPASLGDLAPRSMAEQPAVPQPGFAAPLLEGGSRPSLLGENSARRKRPRLMLQQERTNPRVGVLSPQFRHADISLKWQ